MTKANDAPEEVPCGLDSLLALALAFAPPTPCWPQAASSLPSWKPT